MLRCDRCGKEWNLSDNNIGVRCGIRLGSAEWCDGKLLGRAARIEAAARELLEALPRCGLLHDDEEGVPFGCDKLATHAGVCDGRDGYACGPCRCKTCKPLKWADAARELEKALDGGEA